MKRLLLCILATAITGCGLEPIMIEQVYEGNIDKVSKVVIVDGNTGYSKTVHDDKVINEFLAQIVRAKFIPQEKQEERDGFNYSISFHQEGEEKFSFTLNNIKGVYYNTEPDLYPFVDSFYRGLKVVERPNRDP